ncbi:class I SAM-dependent methyltransferase [Streptacidiphilus anmyonensis]|uniref:class I SAM-dependent methyltransferase n=1 Tax=Streptacidiphilus anmyonensis TaxID=405782 RepID=UPI0005A8AA87|nr:class I SAM-dependent methyltransferase [Streptacidiphilus anmyonensis]
MTQYDELAARLADIEKAIHFYRETVEFPSFFDALGKARGMRVLDVGCGDGVYARKVARQGAAQVVGTDSSAEMIRLAEAAEAEEPLGIRYLVHDLAAMPSLGAFDVVVAVNVLHYADDRGALESMCRQLASQLAPGGRLLAYVGNTECDAEAAKDFGFLVDRPADAHEGDAFTVTIPATPPATVEVRYWPAASLQQALESAGFARVDWEPMAHTAGDDPRAAGLDRLLKNPPGLLLSAYLD